MVSKQQVDTKVHNVQDFRNACLRNGFLVPEHYSRLCTRQFLQEVRSGECFVPKISELKCAPCPEPPKNEEVRDELCKVIRSGINQMNDPAQRKPYERLVWHLE